MGHLAPTDGEHDGPIPGPVVVLLVERIHSRSAFRCPPGLHDHKLVLLNPFHDRFVLLPFLCHHLLVRCVRAIAWGG